MLRKLVVIGLSAALIALTLASAARADEPSRAAPPSPVDGPEDERAHPIESPGLIAGGAVLTTVGLAAVPTGVLVGLLGNAQVQCFAAPCEQPNGDRATAAAAALVGGGALAIGGGIAMMVVGAQADDDEVTVAIGPGNLSVGGRF